MNIKPMFDCVYIEQEVEKHDGLIVMPTTSEKKLFQGTVVAVGPGVRTDHGDWIKLCLNVGDRVLFGEYSGQAVKFEGKTYLAMREKDVIGVFDGV